MTKISTLTKDQLTTIERIRLIGILPSEGGYTQLIILKDLRKKLDFTQKEINEYEIKDIFLPDGRSALKYSDKAKDKKFGFNFTPAEKKEIKTALQKQIDAKKLNIDLFDLATEYKCSDRKDEPKQD